MLHQDKDTARLEELGGVRGLADALHTDLSDGLASAKTGGTSLEGRQAAFGPNRFKAIPLKSFLSLLVGNLKDPTLILLMAAALVSSCCADSSLTHVQQQLLRALLLCESVHAPACMAG